MKAARLAVGTLLVLAGAQTVFAQMQLPLREGNWEVTVQVEMPGMPMKMPDVKDTRCVTREMLKDPAAAVPNASPGSNNDCKVSDYQTTGQQGDVEDGLHRADADERVRGNHVCGRHVQRVDDRVDGGQRGHDEVQRQAARRLPAAGFEVMRDPLSPEVSQPGVQPPTR